MSFTGILADDPQAAERFRVNAASLIDHFASDGVSITADELRDNPGLTALRVSCYSDLPLDVESAARQVRAHVGGVVEQAKTRKLVDAIRNRDQYTLTELASLPPSQRLEIGRKMQAQDVARSAAEDRARATAKSDETLAAQYAALSYLSGAARISAARQMGLI